MTEVVPEFLAQNLVDLWFGPVQTDGMVALDKKQRWFKVDPDFDQLLAKHYGAYTDPALMGAFDRWVLSDVGLVALILLVDQIPRNIYRGQARAFYYDKKALYHAWDALEKGRTVHLSPFHRVFALMPLMHAEDLTVQNRSLEAFTALHAQYEGTPLASHLGQNLAEARRHHELIERFGRFPTRNGALKRPSTPEELEFLGASGVG